MSAHNARGFTLIEMLVIISVLGTVMAFAAPPMSRFVRTNRVTGATNTVAGDLRYARSLASSQRRTYEVRVTPTSYSIVCVSPASTVLTRTLDHGVHFAASDTMTFFAYGLTESATLTLLKDDCSRLVRMNSTGQVTRD
ncbi:MAG: GspH/FimT family pseudopilin [Candidatus Eisenbacteria bacterium]